MDPLLYHSLSGSNIEHLLDGKIKIIRYPELKNYKSIDELLNPYGRVMMLYESVPKYGHWVLIFKNKKKGKDIINFFDSYGFYFPNDEMKYINPEFLEMNDMDPTYLYKLLFSKYPVEQNDYVFQDRKKKYQTCGYWCVCRLYFDFLTLDEFKKMFLDGVKEPDLNMLECVYKINN